MALPQSTAMARSFPSKLGAAGLDNIKAVVGGWCGKKQILILLGPRTGTQNPINLRSGNLGHQTPWEWLLRLTLALKPRWSWFLPFVVVNVVVYFENRWLFCTIPVTTWPPIPPINFPSIKLKSKFVFFFNNMQSPAQTKNPSSGTLLSHLTVFKCRPIIQLYTTVFLIIYPFTLFPKDKFGRPSLGRFFFFRNGATDGVGENHK